MAERKINPDTGATLTDRGWIPYEYEERMAICRESGMSEREAQQVANADRRRAMKREQEASDGKE
jgi:hypothetical protein